MSMNCATDDVTLTPYTLREMDTRLCSVSDDVISKLTAAFTGIQLDDGRGLWESQGLDDYASPEELKISAPKTRNTTGRKYRLSI